MAEMNWNAAECSEQSGNVRLVVWVGTLERKGFVVKNNCGSTPNSVQ